MAATQGKAVKSRNFYHEAMNDPEVLKRREERKKALDAAVKDMLGRAPGRVPSWERERLMQMDRFCLQNNKRCIMWDDAASGFYLLLNWDWSSNCPAQMPTPQHAGQPGWWFNIKEMITPPLMEVSLPEEKLAAWIDAHTMRVHGGFLDKLDKLRRDDTTGKLVLDDPYWEELLQLPLLEAEAEAAAAEAAEREARSACTEAGAGGAGVAGGSSNDAAAEQ